MPNKRSMGSDSIDCTRMTTKRRSFSPYTRANGQTLGRGPTPQQANWLVRVKRIPDQSSLTPLIPRAGQSAQPSSGSTDEAESVGA